MADAFDKIRAGDRLTILVPAGQSLVRTATGVQRKQDYAERTGRVVMRSSHGGWVLNMGGAHGTPGLADRNNIVAINNKPVVRCVEKVVTETIKIAKPRKKRGEK